MSCIGSPGPGHGQGLGPGADRRPVPAQARRRDAQGYAEALAALLRIGGDSFTLVAINDTISGCGCQCPGAGNRGGRNSGGVLPQGAWDPTRL